MILKTAVSQLKLPLLFIGASLVKNQPVNTGDARDTGSIPGSERSLGEGNGNPHHYSCLENSMDGGAWQATVQRAAESDVIDQPTTKTAFYYHHVLAILNNVNNKILPVLCPPSKPVFSCFCLCYRK